LHCRKLPNENLQASLLTQQEIYCYTLMNKVLKSKFVHSESKSNHIESKFVHSGSKSNHIEPKFVHSESKFKHRLLVSNLALKVRNLPSLGLSALGKRNASSKSISPERAT